jgi:predicted DCC family thiol-disulfide oxidoreductase YuxK
VSLVEQKQMSAALTAGGWTPWQLTVYRLFIAAALLYLFWFVLPLSEIPAAASVAAGVAIPALATSTQWSRLAAPVIAAVLLLFVPFRVMPGPPLFAALLFAMVAAPKRISPAAFRAAQAAAILSLVACAAPGSLIPWSDWWSVLIGIPAAIPPAWIPRGRKTEAVERLFYDGGCGLCHHTVQFLIAEDPEGRLFRFAPLGSRAFVEAIPDESVRHGLPDSVVIRTSNGKVLYRSAAAIHVLHRLGGYWRFAAWIGQAAPGALLDAVYDGIARIRHKLFRKPSDVCPLMPKDLRTRFDL